MAGSEDGDAGIGAKATVGVSAKAWMQASDEGNGLGLRSWG